jgi:hypothetical protein
MQFLYKIINGHQSSLLSILLPPPVSQRTNYQLRNQNFFDVPTTRIARYSNSFFPHTARVWNELEFHIQNAQSIGSFTSKMVKNFPNREPLYYCGTRISAVHLARMRVGCSNLNYDLTTQLHVMDSSTCRCGCPREDWEHFLFKCPIYKHQRINLMEELKEIPVRFLKEILWVNPKLNQTKNRKVQMALLSFIRDSARFD